MSNTPRTDALISSFNDYPNSDKDDAVNLCDELETELAAKDARIAEINELSAIRLEMVLKRDTTIATKDAEIAALREAGEKLVDAAYSTCCGANGIYDNTWRNKDGGEIVPEFPHGGFSEGISALGKAQHEFKAVIKRIDAARAEQGGKT